MSGGGSSNLVNSSTWGDLQNQAANYVYDPANPGAWGDLQNKMGDYMSATGAGVPNQTWESVKAGLEKLPEALKGLNKTQQDAAKGKDDVATKLQQLQQAQMHQAQGGSLNELVGLLLQRQAELQKGVTSGQPVPAGNRLGLLGF